MSDIILATNTKMDGGGGNSSEPVKQSSSEHSKATHFLFGENLLTIQEKQESTALFSETSRRTYQVSLSDRLTESLILLGLVKGIIPTSTRKQLTPLIPAIALFALAGKEPEEKQKAD